MNPGDAKAVERLQTARARVAALRKQPGFAPQADSLAKRSYDWEAQYALDEAERRREKQPSDPTLKELVGVAQRCARELEQAGDPIAAAPIRGRAFELEGRPKEALDAYNRVLPADLNQMTAAHVPVLLARIDFFVAAAWVEFLATNPGLKPKAERLIQEADRIVDLARSGPFEGPARARAGIARFHATLAPGLDPKQKTTYEVAAIEHLHQAIELAPNARAGWVWRVVFAQLVLKHYSTNRDDKEWQRRRDQARDALEKAREQGPPGVRAHIDALRQKFTSK